LNIPADPPSPPFFPIMNSSVAILNATVLFYHLSHPYCSVWLNDIMDIVCDSKIILSGIIQVTVFFYFLFSFFIFFPYYCYVACFYCFSLSA
jgi:hypothetical protein